MLRSTEVLPSELTQMRGNAFAEPSFLNAVAWKRLSSGPRCT